MQKVRLTGLFRAWQAAGSGAISAFVSSRYCRLFFHLSPTVLLRYRSILPT